MSRNDIAKSVDLDVSTFRLLSRLAKTWRVSKAEAVRRALEQANASAGSRETESRLAVFAELQQRLDLTPAKADEWQDAVRDARR